MSIIHLFVVEKLIINIYSCRSYNNHLLYAKSLETTNVGNLFIKKESKAATINPLDERKVLCECFYYSIRAFFSSEV